MSDQPADYPSRWETDVVLGDGATVHVRPVRPDDAERIVRFHARQSPESIYFRYFSHHPRLSPREIEHFTNVDYQARMAFVALLGDELIAVARYEPWGQLGQVEAAFFVDDAHHGRGLATLLLEYLAVAAREAGFTVMTASVLVGNTGMLRVFKRAGYPATSKFEDGVVEVRFDIGATPEATAAVAERQRRAEVASVARLLRPRSVAVVGASREVGTAGHELVANLLAGGFQGPVHPVNEATTHVHSVPAYASIGDVPGEIDLALVAVPADRLAEVVEQCGRKGVGALVVLTDGVPGPWLAGTARGWGMRVVGPDALGVLNTDPAVRLHAVPAPPAPALAGTAALSVQSGTLGAAVLAAAGDAGIGVSTFVGLGAKADLSGNDLLQFWEGDDRTRVVLQYLESVGNPRRFFRIARRVARAKPVVVVSTAGWNDEPTWVGSTDRAYSALLTQAGVIEVGTLGELFSAARLLGSQPLPRGDRVVVVAEAAGAANLAARAARREGLDVRGVSLSRGEAIEATLAAALDRDDVDAAVVVARVDQRPGVQAAVDAAATLAAKPVVATWLGLRRQLHPAAVPSYRFPEDGVRALARAAAHAAWRAAPEGADLPDVDDGVTVVGTGAPAAGDDAALVSALDLEGVRARAIEHLGASGGQATTLGLDDALELLAPVGIRPAGQRWVTSLDEALEAAVGIGYPVAIKAAGRPKVARTEATGLALDLVGPDDLTASYLRMVAALGERMDRALVQAMRPAGVDAQVVAGTLPRLGPVVAVGRGGAAGSGADELALRLAPLSTLDVVRLVAASPLHGSVAPEALTDLLQRLSALVAEVPEIVELRLDPVLVSDNGAAVTDVLVRLGPWVADSRPAVRRL